MKGYNFFTGIVSRHWVQLSLYIDGKMTQQIPLVSFDERILASLSHFFGFFASLIIWATQKDKSRFVYFQTVQSMAFDLIVYVVMILVVGCVMVTALGLVTFGIIDIAVLGSQNNPSAVPIRTIVAAMAGIPLLIPCIIAPLVGIIFVARLIASIQTFQGRNFHFPWLGGFLERSMEG
jgi:uncharacterized Tic20 family protein